jgi:hypothetical protein
MMNEKLLGLKEELKQLAKNIKKAKPEFKEKQRGFSKNYVNYDDLIDNLIKLHRFRYEFRHKHIVYCQLRGRKRFQIEFPREGNKPNEEYIDKLMETYGETLRVSA